MFGLLYGLYKYLWSKTEYYVIILGLDSAGKTAFLEQVKSIYIFNARKSQKVNTEIRTMPTVGLNVGKVELATQKLIFWDLGGQSGLRTIWDKYYESCHAIIFMVDAVNVARFQESKAALDSVLKSSELKGVPLLLFANKQDIPNAKSWREVQSYFVGEGGLADKRPCSVQSLSALTGDGIQNGIEWLCQTLAKHARVISPS